MSYFVFRCLNKVVFSDFKIVRELNYELVKEVNLEDTLLECYDFGFKAFLYFILFLVSLSQLVIFFCLRKTNSVDADICMLTMVISFIEFRDNRKIYLSKKKFADEALNRVLKEFIDFESMAHEDLVLGKSVEE